MESPEWAHEKQRFEYGVGFKPTRPGFADLCINHSAIRTFLLPKFSV